MVDYQDQFAGQVAMVTGAGSGMGAATARLLAARGAAVVVVGVEQQPVDAVVASITEAGGRAIAMRGDVTRPEDMDAAVASAVSTFGGLQLAVNNAGIAGPAALPADAEVADWNTMITTNLSGVFFAMKYEIRAMLASGGGAIVNISSVFGDRGHTMRAGYAAAKHGIRGLTRSTAIDYATRGIRINELQPGVINTPMLGSDREQAAQATMLIPSRRIGEPEEVARVSAFLLSDEASYVTGAHITVDGGFLA